MLPDKHTMFMMMHHCQIDNSAIIVYTQFKAKLPNLKTANISGYTVRVDVLFAEGSTMASFPDPMRRRVSSRNEASIWIWLQVGNRVLLLCNLKK